jgi:CRISPR system Cascade subunit CasC
MSKNFVNFHILISHSPSCLNRDDMNMQKTATFGGARRVRISSQSLKRSLRTSHYYQQHFGAHSIRTRELESLSAEFLKKLTSENEGEIEAKWIEKAIQVFTSKKMENDDDVEESELASLVEDIAERDNATKKVAVAPWSVAEFKIIYKVVKEIYERPLTDQENELLEKDLKKEHERKVSKKKPRASDEDIRDSFLLKKIKKEIDGQAEDLRKACGSTLDIAFSGRMATSGLMTCIDGALAVAHSITTHMAEADIDWFTAVDDLVEMGSGHLDTQEFSSGVFYRYASLNLKQLQVNLGLLPDMKAEESEVSRNRALEIAAHTLHMLATVVPEAKQQSFAAHNMADFALVSLADQPVSLANAFEKPVTGKGGLLQPSIDTLLDYWNRIHRGYGLDERVGAFSLAGIDEVEGLASAAVLPDLEKWLCRDGQAEKN